MSLTSRRLQTMLMGIAVASTILIVGCGGGMNAAAYHAQGQQQFSQYDCNSNASFKKAADMEFEKEGDWYPIYMLDLALARVYCDSAADAIKAFQTVDQFVVKKSDRSATATFFSTWPPPPTILVRL